MINIPSLLLTFGITKGRKRGAENLEDASSFESPAHKKQRVQASRSNPSVSSRHWRIVPVSLNCCFSLQHSLALSTSRSACRWDFRDWSCAYDSSLVPLYHILASMAGAQRVSFAATGIMQHRVLDLFHTLPALPECSVLEERFRDPIRRILHASHPHEFPRGPFMVSCERVVRAVIDAEPPLCRTVLTCQSCTLSGEYSDPYHFPLLLDVTTHNAYHRARLTSPRMYSTMLRSLSLSEWVSAGAFTPFEPLHSFNPVCPGCHALGPFGLSITALTTPPLVAFEIANCFVRPELYFTMHAAPGQPDVVYRLSAVTYFGGGHFTCRYIDGAGDCWAHDGQKPSGLMISEGPAAALDLTVLETRVASILYFVLAAQ